jgi:hypothetical protein
MAGERKFRLALILGAVCGAVMAVAISLLLDVLYADALKGTWRDAISKDLDSFFSVSLPPDSLAVGALFLIILAILGLFGAFMGAMFSVIVFRFIDLLTREEKPTGGPRG